MRSRSREVAGLVRFVPGWQASQYVSSPVKVKVVDIVSQVV